MRFVIKFGEVFALCTICITFAVIICGGNDNSVMLQAKEPQGIEYKYDKLGRVEYAIYPDGKTLRYRYDSNGNIQSVEIINSGGNSSGNNDNNDSDNTDVDNKNANDTDVDDIKAGTNTDSRDKMDKDSGGADEVRDKSNDTTNGGAGKDDKNTSINGIKNADKNDLINYNAFKRKKPSIKSLKKVKKKNSIRVSINQVSDRGIYGETGYQIRYAANKKFKKSKTTTVKRTAKGKITNKDIRLKKKKTWYIKVRAYLKMKNGKTIYSKYSKVKKIKVK